MVADVDNDGKHEIITGSTCIDHDGTLKWNTNTGHGDALHVGDLDPTNPDLPFVRPDAKLADWKAGDLCEDDRLDVFDLVLMRRKLING